MNKQANTAYAAAPSGQGYGPGRGAWVLAVLVIAWLSAPGGAHADTIVLKSGEAIEGSIIDATRNTVIIRRAIGGMRQMRFRDIEEIRIDLEQGEEITGEILSWIDGVYQVRSGDEIMRIRDGSILSRAPAETVAAQPARTPPPRPEEAQPGDMAAAPAATEQTATEQATAEEAPQETAAEEVGAEATATEGAIAKQRVAAATTTGEIAAQEARREGQPVVVRASVDRADAGVPSMVFRIQLSRPAEQTVVLIYGTVNGTAKAGIDYEPQEGVVSLAPGARSAEVRVPLIEHPRQKGDTNFELFLTADPTVAKVVDHRVTAAIKGDN